MKTTTAIPVRNYHIDHFGHVNHGRFVELFEEARWQYLEQNNLLEPIHRVGADHVVAEISISYRRPVKIGVILHIQTQVKRRSKHSFWVNQVACRNGSKEIVAEATVTNVFIHDNGRPKRITSDILEIWPDLARAECDA